MPRFLKYKTLSKILKNVKKVKKNVTRTKYVQENVPVFTSMMSTFTLKTLIHSE